MVVTVDKKGRIPLKAFQDVLDISKVDKYTVEDRGDGSVALAFYDKKGNRLPLKEETPKERTAVDEMKNRDIDVPWRINRFLQAGNGVIRISGDQAAISETGDYGSLEEMREVVEWLAKQFGGKADWSKNGQ